MSCLPSAAPFKSSDNMLTLSCSCSDFSNRSLPVPLPRHLISSFSVLGNHQAHTPSRCVPPSFTHRAVFIIIDCKSCGSALLANLDRGSKQVVNIVPKRYSLLLLSELTGSRRISRLKEVLESSGLLDTPFKLRCVIRHGLISIPFTDVQYFPYQSPLSHSMS